MARYCNCLFIRQKPIVWNSYVLSDNSTWLEQIQSSYATLIYYYMKCHSIPLLLPLKQPDYINGIKVRKFKNWGWVTSTLYICNNLLTLSEFESYKLLATTIITNYWHWGYVLNISLVPCKLTVKGM